MANGIVQTGLIERVQINDNVIQRIASTAYGVCSTEANNSNKTVQIDGFELITGVTIHIKFTYDNTASEPPTLNVNGTGAINIVQYNNVAVGTVSETSGWEAGAVLSLTYDGTYWVRDQGYNTNTTYSVVNTNVAGLVPQANTVSIQSQTTKFLREDGSWAIPSYTDNTDANVTQTGVTDDKEYSILFKNTDNTTNETAGVKYGNALNKLITINPNKGTLTAQSFAGSGENLTSLNASNLSDGTVNLARLPTIPNSQLSHSSITVADHQFSLGDTMTKEAFIALLGLSNALHFIGVATNNQISDGSRADPFDNNIIYNGTNGDVIISSDTLHEYIWVNGEWLLLGTTLSAIYDSSNITINLSTNNTPTWISRITQTTDGLIQVEREKFNFTVNQVILSDSTNPSQLVSRGYSDHTSATAFTNNSIEFATERSIYHALPQINNAHNYNSTTTIFAPNNEGSSQQILIANDVTHTPEWASAAIIDNNTSQIPNDDAYTSLKLGNSINKNTATAHSEGIIYLYSADTHGHIIQGASTTIDYTHILPNVNGTFVQIPSNNAAVGGSTQPVYVSANGTVTEINYIANRLYYSASTTSFTNTDHYATEHSIGVNVGATWPTGNTDALYVNGTTTLNSNTFISGNVGIGTNPDTNLSDNHILVIQGNTLFKTTNDAVAHLDINTINNVSSARFIPDVTGSGEIGTSDRKWNSGFFSNLLTIGSSTQGVLINATGKLDIINNNSYIKFSTNDASNNAVGIIEIKSEIPTIILETTSTSINNNGLENSWSIYNEDGDLTITNNDNTLIYANDYGIKITDRLYINNDLDNSSTLDFYVDGASQLNDNVGIGIEPDASNAVDMHKLNVNGSILISHSDDPIAHLDVTTVSNNSYLTFYPYVATSGDSNGYIGLDSARWNSGYFSTILEVGTRTNDVLTGVQLDGNGKINIRNEDSFIILDTTLSGVTSQSAITLTDSNAQIVLYTGNASEANITMVGTTPSITLDTSTNSRLDWIIANNEGIFSINNQQNLNLVSLNGNNLGFELAPRLYINSEISDNPNYVLYISGGNTCVDGNVIPTLNSNDVADKTLGISSAHWAALYVGTADTYGDSALPIYWNNGVPTYTNGVLQKKDFVFSNGTASITLEDTAYNQLYGIETYVIQIVITEGEEYLNSVIHWTSQQKINSTTTGQIILSCDMAASGTVRGYILTARGIDISDSNN